MLCRAAPHFVDPPPYCDERNPLPDDPKIVEFFYNLGIHVSICMTLNCTKRTLHSHFSGACESLAVEQVFVIVKEFYLTRTFQHYNLLRINVYHWNLLFPGNMFSNSKMDSAPPTRQPSPAPPPFPNPPVSQSNVSPSPIIIIPPRHAFLLYFFIICFILLLLILFSIVWFISFLLFVLQTMPVFSNMEQQHRPASHMAPMMPAPMQTHRTMYPQQNSFPRHSNPIFHDMMNIPKGFYNKYEKRFGHSKDLIT